MNEQSKCIEQYRARNLLAPIFSLNDDILIYTFSINSHFPFVDFYSRDFETEPLRATMATSQVCFHWRILCLSTSILWSDIDLANKSPRWREEIQLRASLSPIALRLYDSRDLILCPLVQRLRSFAGSFHEERWIILINEVQRPGSKLRSLSLFGRYKNINLSIHRVHPHALPLKHLALDSVYIHTLNFSLLSNLSTLALRRAFISGMALMNGLMHMPGLTELVLFNSIREGINDEWDTGSRVSLPNLKRLHIIGSDSELDYMSYMSRLDIPAACISHVNFCTTHLTPQSAIPLLSSPQFTIAENQSLSFIVNNDSINIISEPAGFRNTIPDNDRILNQDIFTKHSNVFISNLNRNSTWMSSLYHCLVLLFTPEAPFSSKTTLQLEILEPDVSFPFKIFENIHVLFVAFDTLAVILPIISSESDGGLLFPSLKKIGLTIGKAPFQLDAVISFLEWRRAHNAHIDTLELRYFSRDENWTSFVTLAQRHKLRALEVDLALFFVVDERSLVKTEMLELPVGSSEDQIHKLKSLWDCW